MKKIFLTLFFLSLLYLGANAQKYMLKDAHVRFFSKALLEDIEANNKETKAVIDLNAKTFSFRVPIKDFKFAKELMQEHFNENYMESNKYPNATFKGKIEGDFDLKKNGEYPVNAVGDLDIHGVTQQKNIPSTLKVKNGELTLESKFKVKLVDHKIEIPTVVFQKIAEEIEVSIKSQLTAISE